MTEAAPRKRQEKPSGKVFKRAKFITIERPLLPPPPITSKPNWCYYHTLIFHNHRGEKVWEQEIPEAQLYWLKRNGREGIEFDRYFQPSVFKDEHFGWQLRLTISHERADYWLSQMMGHIIAEHRTVGKLREESD